MALGKKIISSALIVSTLVFAGCGSAGNDQGVSFTLLGFTLLGGDSSSVDRTCALEAYDNSVSIPIGETTESNTAGVETKRCFLVQNNMTNVAVRTERVNLSFYIPGADRQPPSTSIPATIYVGTTSGTDAPNQGSTSTDTAATDTPKGINTVGNRSGAPINMVPPEIRSWISLNRESLPEAPFSIEISASVEAVTTAGDHIESNKAYYQAQVVNDLIINPDDTTTTTDTSGLDSGAATDAALSEIIQ